MAGIYQSILNALIGGGRGGPLEVGLKDYQHAALAFRSNNYEYAPKLKFLFHTYFEINTAAWDTDQPNLGVLVQDIKLPSYSFDTETLNQYNRKRIVQTKIKYNPVSITFLDDNSHRATSLFHAYYSYYYGDVNIASDPTAGGLNRRNIYDTNLSNDLPNWGYQGEPPSGYDSKVPFFKTIQIFGFHQKNYIQYILVNPIIRDFSHDTYNYAEGGGTMRNTCTIDYEAVGYREGSIIGSDPGLYAPGFGDDGFYDKDPSPLAETGGGTNPFDLAPGGDGLLGGGSNNIFGELVDAFVDGFVDGVQASLSAPFDTGETYVFDQQTEFDTGLVDAFTGEAITTTRNTQFAIESQTMTTSTFQAGSLTPGAIQETTTTNLTSTTQTTAGTQVTTTGPI